jgi:hypothetical protein
MQIAEGAIPSSTALPRLVGIGKALEMDSRGIRPHRCGIDARGHYADQYRSQAKETGYYRGFNIILNRVQGFVGFAYQEVRMRVLGSKVAEIEIMVAPAKEAKKWHNLKLY